MKNNLIRLLSIVLVTSIIMVSCKKDDGNELTIKKTNPTVYVKSGTGYTSSASNTLKYNDKAKIGFNAASNGTDSIVSLKVTNGGASLLDSTLNCGKIYKEFSITKDLTTSQKVTFTITDASGRTATTTLELKRVNTISTYSNKVLGAQDTTAIGGFLAAETGNIYKLVDADATATQKLVNIFCFYEVGNDISLASPGTGITGIVPISDSIATWTTKNTSNFVKVNSIVTSADFDACATDDLILTSFSGTAKKVTNLAVGDIIAFKTNNSKYGLLKVTEVKVGATGYVKFNYKIQK